MSAAADLARFETLVGDRLAELSRPDEAGPSFSVGDTGDDDASAELWRLLSIADRDDDAGLVSFDAGDARGLLARARRQCAEFLKDVLARLAHPVQVQTGDDAPRLRTLMSWTGDTVIAVAPDIRPDELMSHTAATRESIDAFNRRLRILSLVVAAARRIATTMTTPGGALWALPLAYRFVRRLYDEWSETNAP